MFRVADLEPAHDAILPAAVEDDHPTRSLEGHEVGEPVDEI